MHKRLLTLCLALLCVLFGTATYAADEPDHEIHQELRALLQGMQQAINTEKYSDLEQYFNENLRVTTINQEVITSRPEITAYFKRWFGPGGYLKKVDMNLKADALTELYADKSVGIVRGSGVEKYILADGRHFDMNTRWTATVAKDADGKWRILALHIGTNFLDNPILNKAEASVMYVGAGGALGGLVLGGLLVFFLVRRKKANA